MNIVATLARLASAADRWRVVRQNLRAGIREKIHTGGDALKFAQDYNLGASLQQSLLNREDPQTTLAGLATGVVRLKRYTGPYSDHPEKLRVNAVPAVFPTAMYNSEVLSGQTLYRVVPDGVLPLMIGTPFWSRPEIADLDLPAMPKGEAETRRWAQSLGGLPKAQRRFPLIANGVLSMGIVWFTNAKHVPAAWAAAPGAHAYDARNCLGLSHYPDPSSPKTMFLFGLSFPGEAADTVGHYRPSAVDSLDNARFLMPRNRAASPFDPSWGRTADLSAIGGPTSVYGLPERVANQIRDVDLAGAEIQFDYLGEVSKQSGESDQLFANRIEAL